MVDAIKRKYNELITRREKADQFYNNLNISDDKKEKWMSEYLNLMQQISICITQYERLTGNKMSSEEVWEGFKD